MNKLELISQLEEGINIVDFWADWCSPCKMVEPILEDLKNSNKINLVKINVDNEGELAGEYSIRSIPTLFFMNSKGEILDTVVGARQKSYYEEIISNLSVKQDI